MASRAFLQSIGEALSSVFPDSDRCARVFELECLLHDVGHAPFSHTGEKFYLNAGRRTDLHKKLVDLTKDPLLEKEILDHSYKTAPHELMSACIALEKFKGMIPQDLASFFARCITGYKYAKEMDTEKSCRNCFIELLNSKIIDVDKLDYLLRDSYMTGFDTISIDYERLLRSIRTIPDSDGLYRICYEKGAVSVLENVVYAHDAERKWIQNHPIVLYETYLLEQIIDQILHELLKEETLSSNMLSTKGINITGHGRLRLMGDSDFRYLMKNLSNSQEALEFYDRNRQKHPLWKTEAEFQAIFFHHEAELKVMEEEFDSLRTHLRSLGLPFILNANALEASVWELAGSKSADLEHEMREATITKKQRHIRWMQIFRSFSEQEQIPFDFLVIYANQFNSGFRKQEFGNIELVFPELKVPCRFGDVSNVLTAEKSRGEKFFSCIIPGQRIKK